MLYVQRQAAHKTARGKIVTAASRCVCKPLLCHRLALTACLLCRTLRVTWALALVCAVGAVFLVVIAPFKHTLSAVGNSLPPVAHQVSLATCRAVSNGSLTHLLQLYERSYPWHISSSYGLFRRMTGVGPDAKDGR